MYNKKLANSIQQEYRRDAEHYRLAQASRNRPDSSLPTLSYFLSMLIIFGLPFFIR